MSRTPSRRDRHILAYAEELEHGSCVLPDAVDVRQLAESHRLPDMVGCFALFAGHGGAVASELCARNFIPTLLGDDNFGSHPLEAMSNSVAAMEAFVTGKSSIDRLYYGTTLLFLMLRGGRIFTANVGDCRAVLATPGGATRLSEDHTVGSNAELERTRAAGAFLADGKINGLLTYTRALGHLNFKDRKHIYFPSQRMTADPILSSVPHLASYDVPTDAQFVILATAQVWEQLSDAAACAIVRAAMGKNEPARQCARRVAQAAMNAGASGDVAVLVVSLAGLDRTPILRTPSRARTSVRRGSAGLSNVSSSNDPSSPRRLLTSRATTSAPSSPRATRTVRPRPDPDSFHSPSPRKSDSIPPRTPTLLNTPPMKRTSTAERNILVETPPSPTTPPVKLVPSIASPNAALYTPTGRGRKTRVLVPIAVWGVAPGGAEPLENVPVPRVETPLRSSGRKSRARTRESELNLARRAESDIRSRGLVGPPIAPPTSPVDPTLARVATAVSSAPTTPMAVRIAKPGARQDSFGVPASLYGASKSAQLQDGSTASGTTVRVSHVTASSKAGASSSAGLIDEAGSMPAEFGRGGPAKVRYREHDLFGFLRRRGRAASRYG